MCPLLQCRIKRFAHFAAATTFFAASVSPFAVVMIQSPLSASILRPSSTLVPSSRTTNGT